MKLKHKNREAKKSSASVTSHEIRKMQSSQTFLFGHWDQGAA